jgi:hypothetical protein
VVTNSFTPGDKVRLRSGALPAVKIREWTFKQLLKTGKLLLEHKPKNYTLEVEIKDIEIDTT